MYYKFQSFQLSFRFIDIFIKDLKKKIRILLQMDINCKPSNNNVLSNSDEKMPPQSPNAQSGKLPASKNDQIATASLLSAAQVAQPPSDVGPVKHKPSEIIENALNKYLKLKATTFNLDKINEVIICFDI